jgi:ubiquinone/menaquinone biosynthesis C-methylase UbiE
VQGTNSYSRLWFDTFLGRIDPAIVDREVAFLRRQLPARARVLDLCCGPGRHAHPLAATGFQMIGLDIDATALGTARRLSPNASFVHADMRAIPLGDNTVDATICMWQSFGHFDSRENEQILEEMARVTRPGGVLILDLYQRAFYASSEGEREIVRDGARIHERRMMTGNRLRVQLEYEPSGFAEEFDWQLYTPAEIATLAGRFELRLLGSFAEFDESIAASPDRPRMQIVLERALHP